MCKIAIGSDIHLEFGAFDKEFPDADILILAGDIFPVVPYETKPHLCVRVSDFFKETEKYKHVIYVMGNHEHYHGDYFKTKALLHSIVPGYVQILDNEAIIIEGVRIFGGTLWTDFARLDKRAMDLAKISMPDFQIVRYLEKVMTPFDSVMEHAKCKFMLENDYPDIVVTHHAPLRASVNKKYRGSELNAAFHSELNELIDQKAPQYWIHGHMHDPCMYVHGKTTVICNPRGYPRENIKEFEFKVVSI